LERIAIALAADSESVRFQWAAFGLCRTHLNFARPLFRSKIAEQELLTGATRSMPSVSLKSLRRGFSEGALIILLLAAAAFLYWPALYAAGSRMDEATLLVYPELMLQGKIAYRDFETFIRRQIFAHWRRHFVFLGYRSRRSVSSA